MVPARQYPPSLGSAANRGVSTTPSNSGTPHEVNAAFCFSGRRHPATSDARGTSVGTLAIDRFLRPVCYQNYPQALLPKALQDGNPLGLRRLVNGQWSDRAL